MTDAQNSGPCGLQEVGGGRRIYAKTFAFLFLERLKIQTEQNRTAGNERGSVEPFQTAMCRRWLCWRSLAVRGSASPRPASPLGCHKQEMCDY